MASPANPGAWPRLMRADTAAAYLGESSVEAFRRSVGVLYPAPVTIKGKGQRWLREDLDAAIDRIAGRTRPEAATAAQPADAADWL